MNDEESSVVLSVTHVDKSFRLPTEQATGIKQALINWTKGIKGFQEQHVLKDISFSVHKGDFFGIVGRNGSGKSTLLKLISGIYVPDSGTISVDGKLVPFIELGVGFNPELTGRENVFLNGALLGFTRGEIEDMYDDIVDFAELGAFMDQKLKNYSSGMQVRLAFSVAIKAQGDILVLDEVLAVGDEAFQRKCDTFFKKIQQDPEKTVILVTHSMDAVKKYCNRALLIEGGDIVNYGDPSEVADQYTLENTHTAANVNKKIDTSTFAPGLSKEVPHLKVVPVSPLVTGNKAPFVFDIEYEYWGDTQYYLVVTMLDIKRGGIPYDSGSRTFPRSGTGKHVLRCELPLAIFNSGVYKIYVNIRVEDESGDETAMIAFTNDENCCVFTVHNQRHEDYGLLNEESIHISLLDSND